MSINFKNDIKPISYIKTNAAEMMKYVNDNHSPIIITQNGEAKAVLMDIESYQNMRNAFALLNIIKISEDEIKRDEYQDSDKVLTELIINMILLSQFVNRFHAVGQCAHTAYHKNSSNLHAIHFFTIFLFLWGHFFLNVSK